VLRIRLLAASCVLGLTACGASATAAEEAPAPAPPIVDCATHVEPSVEKFDKRRDIVRGALALVTLRRDLRRSEKASFRPVKGRLAGVKLPIGVRADHSATLRVSAGHRRHAALIHRDETRDANRIADGDRAVTFVPCAADVPAFSGEGTVGPITGWAGALIVTGARCVRLGVTVDGKRKPDVRLPLGRRCR
jgi:hypothetical protein